MPHSRDPNHSHHQEHSRDLLAPVQPPGRLRSVDLAVLVHALLIGALTWGAPVSYDARQPPCHE